MKLKKCDMKKFFIVYITTFIMLISVGCVNITGLQHVSQHRKLMNTVLSAIEENDTESLAKVLSKTLQKENHIDSELTRIVNSIPNEITNEEYFIVDNASEPVNGSNATTGDGYIKKYYLSSIVKDKAGIRYKIKLEYTKRNELDKDSEGINYLGITPIGSNEIPMGTTSIGISTSLSL